MVNGHFSDREGVLVVWAAVIAVAGEPSDTLSILGVMSWAGKVASRRRGLVHVICCDDGSGPYWVVTWCYADIWVVSNE